jgi:hypothetical protein
MVSNQGWNDERSSKEKHTVTEADMLAAKLDALIKRIDDQEKARSQAVHAIASFQPCEVCCSNGHSGNDCPETREEVAFMNNNNYSGYRPQQPNWNQPRPQYQGGNNFNTNYNQPPLKEIVVNQGKILDALSKKFSSTDKSLESINIKLETFSSSMKNQLSFNKMIKTQLAQLVAAIPVPETGKIPGQPDDVSAISVR